MTYFESLIDELRSRSTRAIQSLLALKEPALREYLSQQLLGTPGQKGALLADPVFEPTFGWQKSEDSLSSLSGNLLHPSLVRNMTSPPKSAGIRPFPSNAKVYRHQLEAWQKLSTKETKSLVVTSGTGSGKTECFMVPVLDSLARAAAEKGTLQGVQAIMIYPLNALINSQQNRLDAWTDGFEGKVRYCLYTGALKTSEKSSAQKSKGHVYSRNGLRESAPPLLVTNATMLEYMLVRKDDAPILEQSKGQLRWIVLDEAHTYIGSQAAEMALLLRRVMHAFKVEPKDVRFIATSATFGKDKGTVDSLTKFLADMAGVDEMQVEVVQGQREVPSLPACADTSSAPSLSELAAIESALEASTSRYLALSAHPLARQIREAFITSDGTRVNTLNMLAQHFASSVSSQDLLAWLSLMSGTRMPDSEDDPFFLPVRLHLFHNVLQGLLVCVDPKCHYRVDTPLNSPDWPYGRVYTDDRTHCECGAPVVSLVSCVTCNEAFLLGKHANGGVSGIRLDDVDEFAIDLDPDPDDEINNESSSSDGKRWLIVNRATSNQQEMENRWFDRATERLLDHCPEGDAAKLDILVLDSMDKCPCCLTEGPQGIQYRSAVIGTPFLLSTVIPAVLEFCPEDDKAPLLKPFRGRKMISFTDSRQGTARTAAKLQQDSERLRVRSLVYHHLLNEQPKSSLTADDEQDLIELLAEEQDGTLRERDLRTLQRLKDLKAESSAGAILSWNQLIGLLAMSPDVKDENFGMLEYYRDRGRELFENQGGTHELAGMFLAREFMRRPKARNNLETMGLVEIVYPELATVKAPSAWLGSVEEWRAYLKVLLDFYVRENSFVSISPQWQRFIGTKFRAKHLLPPTTRESPGRRFKIWPQVTPNTTRQSRPINLLCNAFGWPTDANEDRINFLLQEAWRALTKETGLLTGDSQGVQLDLRKLHFRLSSTVSLCPVTRRFLDTAFCNLSPYGAQGSQDPHTRLPAYTIPRYPHRNGGALDDHERIAMARDWLSTETGVMAMRDQGLWSDLHDRIIESTRYFRSAEHSAQQRTGLLQKYERKFNDGEINLLNCSTTMEMGIDIDRIAAVANNNVPPHPANYLQRAGRAGRRGEGRAMALTVCRRTPHDQHVFSRPLWPFETPMVVPKVEMRSTELVMRHLNAFLLSYWMKDVLGHDELKGMTVGPFFMREVPESGYVDSLAERFSRWCQVEAAEIPEVRKPLQALVYRTTLAHTPAAVLTKHSGKALAEIALEWLHEFQCAEQEKKHFEGCSEAKSAALRALLAQLARLTGAYLLSELAARRFLPGYGFPTDVVTFNNTYYQKKDQRETGHEREDKWGSSRDLPSRDRATALREYAPGAEVVIDGLVYQSRGISLNWLLPPTEAELRETQLFKWAWQCSGCGSTGSSFVLKPSECECCGKQLDPNKDVMRYLVPSGFAVSFFGDLPHTDVDHPVYIPARPSRLSVNEPWIPLANPANGLFRASPRAHMFHHTAGEHKAGFALCLECGRAEPMLSVADDNAPANEGFLPASFRSSTKTPHKRLRGGRMDDSEEACPGNSNRWKIQPDVMLGHDTETDAIELLLRNPLSSAWMNDKVAAFTIAVALRDAVAEAMGVISEELGFSTRQIAWEGKAVELVQVFDLRSGGYTSQAARDINLQSLWDRVLETLQCPHCQNACQNCLIGFDTRFDTEKLDRIRALEWISPTWRNALALPEAERVFPHENVAEITGLLEAVETRLNSREHTDITLYLQGNPDKWDLPMASRLLGRLANWRAQGFGVHLQAAAGSLAQLDEGNLYRLAALVDNGICYGEVAPESLSMGGTHALLVSLARQEAADIWASRNCTLGIPNDNWARNDEGQLLVRGRLPSIDLACTSYTGMEIRPQVGDVEVDIGPDELSGKFCGFGTRFWALLIERSPALKAVLTGNDSLERIEYTDRYTRNPFTVALLVEVLDALKNTVANAAANPHVSVTGQHYQANFQGPRQLWHDWADHDQRDAALQSALEYVGFSANVNSKPAIEHGRMLRLTFESGHEVRIRLDQGMSYWRADRNSGQLYVEAFDFKADAEKQGEALNRLKVNVVSADMGDTQVFIRA
ncbi:DEAD/DEAH box helicase [Pseudomonas putida]|nr:DEAD/DEAH box helicase [Pseudomonas putida]